MVAVVLGLLPYEEGMGLVVAQKDNGEPVWLIAPEDLYTPADGIDEADAYPLSLLSPDRLMEVMAYLEQMPEELYASLLEGWEEGDIA